MKEHEKTTYGIKKDAIGNIIVEFGDFDFSITLSPETAMKLGALLLRVGGASIEFIDEKPKKTVLHA